MEFSGSTRKMKVRLDDDHVAQYEFILDEELIPMNELIGSQLKLSYLGEINCLNCGKSTKKSFSQGFCFPCSQKLAGCDMCIVRPETCHYAEGTCREPTWGEQNCLIPHTVYLANSSGLKVGVTRAHQQLTRWLDQGACQAIKLAEVQNRLAAGALEVILKKHVSDKTDWRRMLKAKPQEIDMGEQRTNFAKLIPADFPAKKETWEQAITINYPVVKYPEKVASLNLEKTPEIDAKLEGIKGQYLIFDSGVINIRKYAGYKLRMQTV